MRVLHVIASLNPDDGGLPKAAASLSSALAANGAETGLLHYSSDSQEAAIDPFFGNLPGFNLVQRLALKDPNPAEWLFSRKALRLAGNFRPDVIHTHGVWEPLLRNHLAWAQSRGIPTVVQCHGMLHPFQNRKRPLAKAILRGLLRWPRQWRGASFCLALTPVEKSHLEAQAVNRRIEVVPNGIFEREAMPRPPAGAYAAAAAGMRNRPYILCLARLDPGKSQDVLVDAFHRLSPRLPGLCLVLAGPDYGFGSSLRRQVESLGLGDRVFFPGALTGESKREALAGASVFCLPSRSEGFSVAILEAAAFGVPLVISRECCFTELADAGGALLSPIEPEALAQSLLEVAGSPARAAAMGEAARALILDRYTWPTLAKRLHALYLESTS